MRFPRTGRPAGSPTPVGHNRGDAGPHEATVTVPPGPDVSAPPPRSPVPPRFDAPHVDRPADTQADTQADRQAVPDPVPDADSDAGTGRSSGRRGGPGRVRGAWAAWGLAVSAYFVAVFHRTSLGVASLEAERRFHTGP